MLERALVGHREYQADNFEATERDCMHLRGAEPNDVGVVATTPVERDACHCCFS